MAKDDFANFLQGEYVKFVKDKGRYTSQAEFATWLGISNYNYSQYINNYRKPQGKNVDRIASKLGPRVYEILGITPRMPDDPKFMKAAKLWFSADDDRRNRALAVLLGNGDAPSPSINHAVE